MSSTLLAVSLAFSFGAYPAYAHGIYRQNARPTRPTWLMILVTDVLLFAFMLVEARFDWLMLGFTAGNLMMLALMAGSDLKDARMAARESGADRLALGERVRFAVLGRDPWTAKDKASVAIALGALLLWAVTGSGLAALVFSLIGKIAASVPMWINLYRDPTREAILPWALWLVGGGLYLLTIPQPEWSFSALATPILFVVLETIVIALLFRRFDDQGEPPLAA